MNADRWERRIVRLSFATVAVLGIASAGAAMVGLQLGHPAVLDAGIVGLVAATAIGFVSLAATSAIRTLGNRNRNRRSGRQ